MAKFEVLAPGHLSPPRDAGPPQESRLGGLRRTVHGLAIVAGWLLFFWGWKRVLAAGPDFSELRVLMIGAAIVVPVVTVSWILHNRGIHRRKGPRRSVPSAALDYRVDFHGREVLADFGALEQARRVDIVVFGATKRYGEVQENGVAFSPPVAGPAARVAHVSAPAEVSTPAPTPASSSNAANETRGSNSPAAR